jgi:hypothetical protein
MPVINFDNLEAVPEGLKEFAKTVDGKVTVNVVANDKLDEFRQRNVDLSKQLETAGPILARVKELAGDDLDAFAQDLSGLRDISKRVKDGELKTDDQIEQAVQDRLKVVRDGYEDNAKALRNELQTTKAQATSLSERLNRTRIDKEVTSVVIQPNSGVRPEALPDVLERAYRLFHVTEDKLVPKRGEATVYGANGADPMTVAEWIVKLRDEAPHYFGGNSGGGASGGKDKVGGYTQQQIAGMSAAQKLALANTLPK